MKDFAYRWILSAMIECAGDGDGERVEMFMRCFIVVRYIHLFVRAFLAFSSVPVAFVIFD